MHRATRTASSKWVEPGYTVEIYYQCLTAEEKKRLWKLVLKKVTVYRSQDGELSIHLYPNLPQGNGYFSSESIKIYRLMTPDLL